MSASCLAQVHFETTLGCEMIARSASRHCHAWLLLWVSTGLGCTPTDNIVGATRGGPLSGVAAGSAGEIASGGTADSTGGTAGSLTSGPSQTGGVAGSPV